MTPVAWAGQGDGRSGMAMNKTILALVLLLVVGPSPGRGQEPARERARQALPSEVFMETD